MSHTGTAHPFHMWTKFGDDMSKRSWVMLDKTDRLTDRQTDRQTDKPTNEHTCQNCKFWQVTSSSAVDTSLQAWFHQFGLKCNDKSDTFNYIIINVFMLKLSLTWHMIFFNDFHWFSMTFPGKMPFFQVNIKFHDFSSQGLNSMTFPGLCEPCLMKLPSDECH